MELRHLRYFVAVAEELHFTRAAERLGMKQPPLSLQIQQLEKELETRLFKRLTRGIEITETGSLLLEKARGILADIDQMKATVRSHARGEIGRINVGFAGATYASPLVPKIIRTYREQYPGVLLTPQQSNTPQLVATLGSGETDIAFIRPPISESRKLAILPLIEEPMLIVVAAEHPLADAQSLPLAALAQEPLILFPRVTGPGLYDRIISACQVAGFSPILGQEAPEISSVIYMVASAFGVSIVPQSSRIQLASVSYLPIEDGPLASIGLAYRRDDHSTAVRHFVEVARRVDRDGTHD